MAILIPDDVLAMAERKAKAAGAATVADYVAKLIRDDVESLPSTAAGPSFRTREELIQLLREGYASGNPVVADDAFWEDLREQIDGDATTAQGAYS